MNARDTTQKGAMTTEGTKAKEIGPGRAWGWLRIMKSVGANARKGKVPYRHEYRKQLLAKAAKAASATYGSIHTNRQCAPLNLIRTD